MDKQKTLAQLLRLKTWVERTMKESTDNPEVLHPDCSIVNLFVILGKVNREVARLTPLIEERKIKLCAGCYHEGPCGFRKGARILVRDGKYRLNCWRAE